MSNNPNGNKDNGFTAITNTFRMLDLKTQNDKPKSFTELRARREAFAQNGLQFHDNKKVSSPIMPTTQISNVITQRSLFGSTVCYPNYSPYNVRFHQNLTLNNMPFQQNPFVNMSLTRNTSPFNKTINDSSLYFEDTHFDYTKEWDLNSGNNLCLGDQGDQFKQIPNCDNTGTEKEKNSIPKLDLEKILSDSNPKWQKSKFINFLKRYKDGEIIITDDEIIENENLKEHKPPYAYAFRKDNRFINSNSSSSVDSDNLFGKSIAWMRKGSLSKAVEGFEAVVSNNPSNEEAWIMLGKCHSENEEESLAITAFDTCLTLNPRNVKALLFSAKSLANDKNAPLALMRLEQFKEIFSESQKTDATFSSVRQTEKPQFSYTDFRIENDNFYNRNEVEALKSFFKEETEKTHNFLLREGMAVLLSVEGNYEAAAEEYKKLLQFGKSDPSLWNRIGASLANAEKYDLAIEAYEKALRLRPNYVRALVNAGISFHNKKEYEKAIGYYAKALELNPNASQIWELVSSAHFKCKNLDLSDCVKEKNLKKLKEKCENFK